MNYGLSLSAAGVLTSMHRQDVAAHNLANATTVGFKRDLAAMRQRDVASVESASGGDAAQAMLDRLGGGLFVQPSRIDTTSGPLNSTGNDLDLAIRGTGAFTVASPDGKQTYVTRDGRFSVSPDGRLTNVDGRSVLSAEGQPITLSTSAPVQVDSQGGVHQNNKIVGQLGVIDVGDGSELRHAGGSLYTAPHAVAANKPAAGTVVQGQLEQSNVDPVHEMMEMLDSSRDVNTSANMIHYQDLLMDRAVNTLGRVA